MMDFKAFCLEKVRNLEFFFLQICVPGVMYNTVVLKIRWIQFDPIGLTMIGGVVLLVTEQFLEVCPSSSGERVDAMEQLFLHLWPRTLEV